MADIDSPEILVDPIVLASALDTARAMDPSVFQKNELDLLFTNSRLSYFAITNFHEQEGRRLQAGRGPEIAAPGFQGALCGSYMMRMLAEVGPYDLEEIITHQRHNFRGHRLHYPGEVSAERIKELLGQEAGASILTIKHPAAQAMAVAMIKFSTADYNPTEQAFLRANESDKPKPQRKRQTSGRPR